MNTAFEHVETRALLEDAPVGARAKPPPLSAPPGFSGGLVWPKDVPAYAPRPPSTRRSRSLSSRIRLNRALAAQIFALGAGAIGVALLFIRFSHLLESMGQWGYVGVAAAEFGGSAMLLLPTPTPAYTFAMGATLNPLAVGAVGGLFATLGELVGYYLGSRGSSVMDDKPFFARFRSWTDRWGGAALFWFAVLPVPFDVAGVWAGTARYPLIKFIPVVLAGKTVKVTMIALAGYFGLETLMKVVG